jgi:hypothetical protein
MDNLEAGEVGGGGGKVGGYKEGDKEGRVI